MTKIIQFSNEFDVLPSRDNNPWMGGQPCTSSAAFSPGILGNSEIYKALEEATLKLGRIGEEGRDFLPRLAGRFLGLATLVKAESEVCDCCL